MKAVIKIESQGPYATVNLNGLDIHNAITGYTIRQESNNVPRVELELASSMGFEGEGEVDIPNSTRATLIAMGWTAPPEEE